MNRRVKDATTTGAATPTNSSEARPRMNRRTRRRQEGRDQVYATAVALFVEQGFSNTTMDQIAERADVARATVFNYFSRKTAFLDEWTAIRRARAAAAIRETDTSDWPLDRILRRYMSEMAKLSEETRAETVALLSATLHQTNFLAHPVLADELGTLVREAQEAGEIPADRDGDQIGLIVATSYFAVLDQWVTAPADEAFDLDATLQKMLDVILHGIYGATKPRRTRK